MQITFVMFVVKQILFTLINVSLFQLLGKRITVIFCARLVIKIESGLHILVEILALVSSGSGSIEKTILCLSLCLR